MKRLWWLVCAGVLAAACGEENPTGVGAGLLPENQIETFEVFLDADQYLVWDSAFGNYTRPAEADLAIIAQDYAGVLDSHVLVRYTIPRVIRVRPAGGGAEQPDSMPIWIGGDIRLPVDTLASSSAADLALYRSTQQWDRESATWQLRVDSGGIELPWAQPGGSPGELAGTGGYVEVTDTVEISVDSATIAEWADTTVAGRGGVITALTPNTRIRIGPPLLRVRARSTVNPDTVVEVGLTPIFTFIFSPELPAQASEIRIGGTPSWRSVLRFRDGIDTMTVPCPGEPGCRVRLDEVGINHAALLLQPTSSPAGFEPELPLEIALHLLLPTPNLPLQRSPISLPVAGTAGIPGSTFLAPGAPVIELAVTEVMRASLGGEENAPPTSSVALLQSDSYSTFGFGTFASRPRLRLILSISKELQLP